MQKLKGIVHIDKNTCVPYNPYMLFDEIEELLAQSKEKQKEKKKETPTSINSHRFELAKEDDDMVSLIFESHKPSPIRGECQLELKQIIQMYLSLSYIDLEPKLALKGKGIKLKAANSNTVLHYYMDTNKSHVLNMRYIDYTDKTTGLLTFDTQDLKFGLLLTHMKHIIGQYEVLTFNLEDVSFVYQRNAQELTLIDSGRETYYLDNNAIDKIRASYHNYITRGFPWNVYIDDKNKISIAFQRIIINGKSYDEPFFQKLGLLLYQY